MILIAGRAKLHRSVREEFVRAASVVASASRDEPGCIDYRMAIDIEDPLALQLYEKWESADALEAHFATAHFLSFSEVLGRALDGAPDFTRFEIASSAPLSG